MVLRPGDRQLIKEWNEGLVLDLIRRHGQLTRVEIAELTGLGRSTVTVISGRLIRQGLIEENGSVETMDTGRRPTLLKLQERSRSVLGLKLAPTEVTASALDLNAIPCTTVVLPLRNGESAQSVIDTLSAAARQVMDEAPCNLGPVIGAGLVMPGVVDPTTGVSINPYFPSWASLPLRLELEANLGIPVLVDNDANAMALAESRYGAGQGFGTVLGVTLGVGIGAGLIINGKLHRGYRSGAGEIGHTIVDIDGPLCRCEKRGCLEAVASDMALLRQTGRSREEVVAAAQAGEWWAMDLLAETGRRIGNALANHVNLLSPDLVVVGGEMALQAGPLVLNSLCEAIRERAFAVLADVPVLPAQLGSEAWVRGAASLVLEQAFQIALHTSELDAIPFVGPAVKGEGR